ncbi:single-stranded-DNA-specific exonuclease RecJ [Tautonia sociabilis]|uniref:Single-stranded-DNA-specific exonuclease RecJ n=1 Tax=Tautonia sociabilis TaxID=2080755 RepID=A0A432MRA9_9BACT|nr:single-stranded-DNA-specific exonuclease RecJ [Tautonia sociabilis]RUL89557.1 single-stranded-DNA-specific exonuclease RecJ [Tautonia sociabilis]
MSSHRWQLRPSDPARVSWLGKEAGIPPLVAQILLNRGVDDPAKAIDYIEARRKSLHDPELLPGVAEAADRIVRAVKDGRKIVIYGDYDVDGVCGTSILWSCLRLAGARSTEYYIPHRVEEGYGLNADALKKVATELGGSVVVTVDCGITSVREARVARELGLELIVTDHHTIGPDLPEADALVHPRLPGGTYPFGELCGAGVAFKLAWQICKSFGDGKKASPHLRDFLMEALGLVALATVADMVPLEDENRIFVRHGLDGIRANPSVGLTALMRVSNCLGRKKLSTGSVGFGLAPRINAAGRLERAMLAVEMLTTNDPARAENIAEQLDACNRKRQEIEQSIVADAKQMMEAVGGLGERGAVVLGHPDWHPGVIGIVAGRLAEIYHRPSIVMALRDDLCQGSGRSIPGFDLYEAIRACSDGLLGFGGHRAAAGLRMTPDRFDGFAERFDHHCRGSLTEDQKVRKLDIDAEVRLAELSLRVVEAIEWLEPYGVGNPRPVFSSDSVRIVGEPRVVGDRKNHVQLRLSQNGTTLKGIAWNMADRLATLAPGTDCAIAFLPSINEWNGRREVQLEIRDVRLSSSEGAHHARSA